MASLEERIGELTARMLRKQLYVILTRSRGSPDEIKQHLPAHLDYMIGLERQGLLFASGPFADADGSQPGHGMTIVRTKNAADARALAEGDPFYVAGLRTFEVRAWTVMEGSLGITVNFSDQSIEIA